MIRTSYAVESVRSGLSKESVPADAGAGLDLLVKHEEASVVGKDELGYRLNEAVARTLGKVVGGCCKRGSGEDCQMEVTVEDAGVGSMGATEIEFSCPSRTFDKRADAKEFEATAVPACRAHQEESARQVIDWVIDIPAADEAAKDRLSAAQAALAAVYVP